MATTVRYFTIWDGQCRILGSTLSDASTPLRDPTTWEFRPPRRSLFN